MHLDEATLRRWADVEDWGDYLSGHGAFEDGVSREQFEVIEREFFQEVQRRIDLCEEQLQQRPSALLHYTLAQLHDRNERDRLRTARFKQMVRYHAIRAIRLDRRCAGAWALLAAAYASLGWIGRGKRPRADQLEELWNDLMPEPLGSALLSEPYLTQVYALTVRQRERLRLSGRAIRCLRHALSLEPQNRTY